MRQKLGLCCSLIHDPDLLILDEPTTGVDPLSRRQFWELIDRMRARRPGMSVVVATAYMEEAERFDWLVAMNAGKVARGRDAGDAQTGDRRQHDRGGLHRLCCRRQQRAGHHALQIPPRRIVETEPVIVARNLTCRFGDFTAVDHVSFTIERGEIFGFVGSNGCGKTTTMKMLTGLLPASEGEALLFGRPLDASDLKTRYRVGYMSQSFSLYTELTVRQNLDASRAPVPPAAAPRRRRASPSWSNASASRIISTSRSGSAARHPPAAVACRRHRPPTRDADPRRADLGRRPVGARPVLGIADRSVAQPGRDDLCLDPFHERSRALRPHLADGFRTCAGDRYAGRT